jgi:zinc transporter ZupT
MDILFIICSLLISVIVGGGFVSLVSGKNSTYLIKFLLAFSGGFLLSIAFMHFIPELYHHANKSIGYFILAGFLVQLLLEYFSEGVEHGHAHNHSHADHGHTHIHAEDGKKWFKNIPFALLLSLSVHSVIEGIPVFGTLTGANVVDSHGHNHGNDNSLLLGIILHQIPVAIALMTVFISKGMSKSKQWFWLLVFGCMTPIGVVLGMFISPNEDILNFMLAVVVGMFLHISTTIIFESGENHKYNIAKLSLILLGASLASLL